MKTFVSASNYSFNASGGTITFSTQIPPTLESILSITNTTRGALLFQPQAGAAYAGTYASPTLTLAASTAGMANGDRLLIFYDDGAGVATAALQTAGNASLTSIDGKLPPLSSGRVPVDIGNATVSVGTVEITNDVGNPIPVSGAVTVTDGSGPITVDGTVSVGNFPASQTVAGTVTANAGTNLNTSALALEAGGNLAAVVTGIGTAGTSPPTLPGGSSGVFGWFRYLTSLLPSLVSGRWPATLASAGATGSAVPTTANLAGGSDGTNIQALSVDSTGRLQVIAAGTSYRSTATITRPANQTPYVSGDVIGDTGGSAIITLSNIGPSGGFIQIQSLRLQIYSATVPTSLTTGIRLHFYTSSPTAIADNAAWDLVSGDRSGYLDYIDLPPLQDMGSTLFTRVPFDGSLFKLANGSTSLFVLMQLTSAATFAENSTVLDLRVSAIGAGI